jgi:hypothetical protein
MRPLHGWQVTDPSTIYAVTAVTHEAGVHVGVRHPGASTRGDEGQTPDQPIPSTTAISDTAPDLFGTEILALGEQLQFWG